MAVIDGTVIKEPATRTGLVYIGIANTAPKIEGDNIANDHLAANRNHKCT